MRRLVRLLATVAVLAPAPVLACAPPPLAIRDLDIPRYYADAKGSVVDPQQRARHDAAIEPLKRYLQGVVLDADKSLRASKPEARHDAAVCALSWIAAWAGQGAWLGHMAQPQSEYQRKWDLAGVALAYLKVRDHASAAQRGVIEPWLRQFADAALKFFDDPSHKRNNHWYWLGLGVAGVAIATDSDRHWTAARGIMRDAARAIAADGTLPMELARGGRALHYHAFSVMPVVLLAEIGQARGEDWYGFDDGAVHRLVSVTLRGHADPGIFSKLSGVPQEPNAGPGGGWLHLYALRFPDRLDGVRRPDMAKGHRWIGGDALLLGGILRRKPG